MIITEALFECFREWHRHVVARAFLANDDNILLVLSSMNILPGGVKAPQSSSDIIALEIYTQCCKSFRVFTEEDRSKIVQLLWTRSSFQTGSDHSSINGEMDLSSNTLSANTDVKNIIEFLRMELHLPSCWWRQGDVVRQVLRSPRLALMDLALIRHRCAAVVVMENPSSILQLEGHGVTTNEMSFASKRLLPRGSSPSFVRNSLLLPLEKWLLSWVTRSSHGLTSSTSVSLLHAIFPSKRMRQAEDNEEEERKKKNQGNDLVSSVSLLMALFGYTVMEKPLGNTFDAAHVADTWCQLGVNMLCYFCGGRPLLKIENVLVEQKQDIEDDGVDETKKNIKEKLDAVLLHDSVQQNRTEETSDVENGDQRQEETVTTMPIAESPSEDICEQRTAVNGEANGASSSCVHLHYTLLFSEQSDCSGHYDTCPWKMLFLSPVLADAALSSSLKEINFDVCEADKEKTSLRLCFKLPEVVKLVECWRRSLYTDSVWKETYAKNSLSAAVRSVIPSPADSVTEAFLKELASRSVENENLMSTPLNSLFDDRSFWDSYFRVASFLKLSVERSECQTHGEVGDLKACSKSPEGKGGDWKATYDAGRRCIFAAVEDQNEEITTKCLQKFTELYQHNLRQDTLVDCASPPLKGAMGKIFQLLSADMSADLHQCGNIGDDPPAKPQLSAQDQKRIQSFLNVLDNVVENGTQEVTLRERSDPSKLSASPGKSGDTNTRQGGNSNVQKQQQKRFQRQAPAQKQQQQQQRLQQSAPPHGRRTPSGTSEGILPLPSSGVLQPPDSFLQQHQLPPPMQPSVQGFLFANPNRNIAQGTDGAGVLDEAYMQRPFVVEQRYQPAGKFALERKGGGRGGGNRRGGRGGGGGRVNYSGGNPFKG